VNHPDADFDRACRITKWTTRILGAVILLAAVLVSHYGD